MDQREADAPEELPESDWANLPAELLARIVGPDPVKVCTSGVAQVCRAWHAATRSMKRVLTISTAAEHMHSPVLRGGVLLTSNGLWDVGTGVQLRSMTWREHTPFPKLSSDGRLVVEVRDGVVEWTGARDAQVLARFDSGFPHTEVVEVSNVVGVACICVDDDELRITSPDGTSARLPPDMEPMSFSRDALSIMMRCSAYAERVVIHVFGRDGKPLRHVDLGPRTSLKLFTIRPVDGDFTLLAEWWNGKKVKRSFFDATPRGRGSGLLGPASLKEFPRPRNHFAWTPDGRLCAFHHAGHVCVAQGSRVGRVQQRPRVVGRMPLYTKYEYDVVYLAFDTSDPQLLYVMLNNRTTVHVMQYHLREFGVKA